MCVRSLFIGNGAERETRLMQAVLITGKRISSDRRALIKRKMSAVGMLSRMSKKAKVSSNGPGPRHTNIQIQLSVAVTIVEMGIFSGVPAQIVLHKHKANGFIQQIMFSPLSFQRFGVLEMYSYN